MDSKAIEIRDGRIKSFILKDIDSLIIRKEDIGRGLLDYEEEWNNALFEAIKIVERNYKSMEKI